MWIFFQYFQGLWATPLKSFMLSSLFQSFFFFLPFWLNEFHCPVFQFTGPSFCFIWFAVEPSTVFSSSDIVFSSSGTSSWYFPLFSTSLLKFSLCSPIVLLNLVRIFVTFILYSFVFHLRHNWHVAVYLFQVYNIMLLFFFSNFKLFILYWGIFN